MAGRETEEALTQVVVFRGLGEVGSHSFAAVVMYSHGLGQEVKSHNHSWLEAAFAVRVVGLRPGFQLVEEAEVCSRTVGELLVGPDCAQLWEQAAYKAWMSTDCSLSSLALRMQGGNPD